MNVKVLMTIAEIDPKTGGPARSVPGLANALIAMGVNSDIYLQNIVVKEKACIQNFSVRNIKDLQFSIDEILREGNSEVILHNHGIWLPVNHRVSIIAHKNNIPIIISPRGMLEPWARNFKKLKKTIAWYCYQYLDLKRASVIHATSQMEAKNIKNFGLNLPIAVVPNGIDPPTERVFRTKKKHTKKALFLSRIHPKKGLINLVRAWNNVLPKNWQVIIAGPDESNHKKEVVAEIDRCGLSNIFKFKGEVSDKDKWELYKESELFILPTFSENFGIVILEALACGLPVITTKGAPWQEIERYKCGWWVDSDINALSTAISEAVNLSDDDRYFMGANGRKFVIDNYSWSKIAEEMNHVYSWVLNGGAPPTCIMLPT